MSFLFGGSAPAAPSPQQTALAEEEKKKSLKLSQATKEQLQEFIKKQSKKLEDLKVENELQQQQIVEALSELSNARGELSTARAELENSKAEFALHKEELAKQTTEAQDKTEFFEFFEKQKLEDEKKQLEEKIEDLEMQNQLLQQDLKRFKAASHQKIQEISETWGVKLQSLRKELSERQTNIEEIPKLQETIRDRDTTIASLKDQLSALRNSSGPSAIQLAAAVSERDALKAQVSEMQLRFTDAKVRFEAFHNSKLAERNSIINTMEAEIEELKLHQEALKREAVESARSGRQSFENDLSAMRRELDELLQRTREESAFHEEEMRFTVAQTKEELGRLQGELDAEKDRLREALEDKESLKEMVEGLVARLEERLCLQSEIERLKTDKAEEDAHDHGYATERCAELECELAECRESLAEAVGRLAALSIEDASITTQGRGQRECTRPMPELNSCETQTDMAPPNGETEACGQLQSKFEEVSRRERPGRDEGPIPGGDVCYAGASAQTDPTEDWGHKIEMLENELLQSKSLELEFTSRELEWRMDRQELQNHFAKERASWEDLLEETKSRAREYVSKLRSDIASREEKVRELHSELERCNSGSRTDASSPVSCPQSCPAPLEHDVAPSPDLQGCPQERPNEPVEIQIPVPPVSPPVPLDTTEVSSRPISLPSTLRCLPSEAAEPAPWQLFLHFNADGTLGGRAVSCRAGEMGIKRSAWRRTATAVDLIVSVTCDLG